VARQDTALVFPGNTALANSAQIMNALFGILAVSAYCVMLSKGRQHHTTGQHLYGYSADGNIRKLSAS
jgi:hypothetical protein